MNTEDRKVSGNGRKAPSAMVGWRWRISGPWCWRGAEDGHVHNGQSSGQAIGLVR
jgi:hypothetical protein